MIFAWYAISMISEQTKQTELADEQKQIVQQERVDENGERILFSWRSQEHININKLKQHKKWVLVLSVATAVWALLQSNFLFLVILVLWGMIVLVMIDVKPRIHEFLVMETGIKIGDELFAYIDMRKFWVIQEIRHRKKVFVFKFTNPMKGKIYIPVPADRAEDIRLTINQYVPQSEHEYSILDSIDNLFS